MSFDYQLSRSSRRKTLAVVIRHGEVKVMAPDFVSEQVICDFIAQRQTWIMDKLAIQQDWVEQKALSQKRYVEAELFLHFGQPLPLHFVHGVKNMVVLQGGELVVCLTSRVSERRRTQTCKKLLQNWYKRQLTEYLDQSIDALAQAIGVNYAEVKVRAYKRRWGSCSSQGVLSFNLLLAMAPPFVVDYVIIHELCHRIHMNHSSQFWCLVRQFCPDFEQAKLWLKDHGDQLNL